MFDLRHDMQFMTKKYGKLEWFSSERKPVLFAKEVQLFSVVSCY